MVVDLKIHSHIMNVKLLKLRHIQVSLLLIIGCTTTWLLLMGKKLGKSLGNGIFCHELFSGENPQLDRAYSPMTIRFFILQSHYRSTLDFSNEGVGSCPQKV